MTQNPKRPNISSLINSVLGSQPAKPETSTPAEEPSFIVEPIRRTTFQTFLIVGLGNPGREYANTRHNVGFMMVERLAERLGITFTRAQHKALITDARYQGHKLILVKPQTYMNESGQAVVSLLNFYKIPDENLIVAFDDMDLPLGQIRIRPKGGSSGAKGMKSIIQRLGHENFPRIRLGIGRPSGRIPPPDYLLQDFTYDEQTRLAPVLTDATDAVLTFVTEGLEIAMNRFNGTVASN
ncbi:MAG TPA: aminoacyl-tRNA hydrolase [Anaerolineales bacterium]|nr:aminoacyl-tRNA hydrolase [Anaerolineales bacterium]